MYKPPDTLLTALLTICMLTILGSVSHARTNESGHWGWRHEDRIRRHWDRSTVETVEGRILALHKSVHGERLTYGIHLLLETENTELSVHLGPAWYVEGLKLSFEEGDRIECGMVHIAPPDHHLLVNGDGTLSLSHSELVHFVRPSADLLFESVAASHRERAIAVVLTRTGSDGDMGVQAIKSTGGLVIAQDPESAEFPGMPRTAIDTGCVDLVLPLDEIPDRLLDLVDPCSSA